MLDVYFVNMREIN